MYLCICVVVHTVRTQSWLMTFMHIGQTIENYTIVCMQWWKSIYSDPFTESIQLLGSQFRALATDGQFPYSSMHTHIDSKPKEIHNTPHI